MIIENLSNLDYKLWQWELSHEVPAVSLTEKEKEELADAAHEPFDAIMRISAMGFLVSQDAARALEALRTRLEQELRQGSEKEDIEGFVRAARVAIRECADKIRACAAADLGVK